jgi:casein kinase 1
VRRTVTPLTDDNVEKVLHNLAGLKLDARPILGDRTRDANTPPAQNGGSKPSKLPLRKKASPAESQSQDTAGAASTDSGPAQARDKVPVDGKRMPKAAQLRVIASSVGKAIDNLALAHAVQDFVRILRDTSSRNLTLEGFAVLDALNKQLADPSVFVAPLRSRQALETGSTDAAARQPRYTKANQLANLKRDAENARSNGDLAKVVSTFGILTNQSNGRTITKDGFAILDVLASQLKALA